MDVKANDPTQVLRNDLNSEYEHHCPLCDEKTEQQFVVVESLHLIKEKAICRQCKLPVLSKEYTLH